jgi:hypothetical protein
MSSISYWMSEGVLRPGSLADALELTGLTLEHEDGDWVLLLRGYPREWHTSEESAQASAARWGRMEPSVMHLPGGAWLVMAGDQYLFSSPSRQEAEGFVFGVVVGERTAADRRRRG